MHDLATEPGQASFALIADPSDCPAFASFAQGSQEYPDRSATILLAVDSLAEGDTLELRGPGIAKVSWLRATPWPADILSRLAANRALFPRGVDLLLAGPDCVAGLPRSVGPRRIGLRDDMTARIVFECGGASAGSISRASRPFRLYS